jgi:protein-disulfide isomerase
VQGPLHQLLEEHQGQVKLVYVHTCFSPRSTRAAEAAECAYQQGKFWTYKDRVFEMQSEWSKVPDWQQRIISYGKDAGLDMELFVRCMETGGYRPAVLADIRVGETYKINSTPTIIMSDGNRFVGSDIEPIRQAVEGALRIHGGR